MKNILGLLCILAMCLGSVTTASAISFMATLTADNHYALYYGSESGVTFVGRNELGPDGSDGGYNWSDPEVWDFGVNGGDYIYVVGWSDDAVAQGWIGQFVSGDVTIFSNTRDWEVYLHTDTDTQVNYNLGDGDPAPSVTELQTEIGSATWTNVYHSVDYGSNPWGTFNPFQHTWEADWIWGSQLLQGSGYGEYQIFRTQVSPVPEPATMLLLGTGLIGLAGLGRKKYFKK